MKLLKIGPLNCDTERWVDALSVFDEVHVLLYADNPEIRVEHPQFVYHELKKSDLLSRVLLKIIRKANSEKRLSTVCNAATKALALHHNSFLHEIAEQDYSKVHVSYNDFDESSVLFLLLDSVMLLPSVTRAYKESRPGFNWLERESFAKASRIVLNRSECLDFFQQKYGEALFADKQVFFDLDEDFVGRDRRNQVEFATKLSSIDGYKHVVILAGRVMSDNSDPRSGSRLFYIPLIQEFLSAGLCVHLHTLKVIPDSNGVDKYAQIEASSNGMFRVESPLDFSGLGKNEAYKVLSRYDFGILHNYIEGTENTQFDKYNIPHRYYEYQVAKVIPVLPRGKTIVMERFLNETNSGYIYDDPVELISCPVDEIGFYTPTFYYYINKLYG